MDYEFYKDKIGSRFDIIQGELVETENGMFLVTETFSSPSIYVNKVQQTATLVSPKDSYIGRSYGLRQADCVAICFLWHDKNKGTNLMSLYKRTSNREFYEYYVRGMGAWFLEHGFTQVTEMQVGDMLVYENVPGAIAHIAVYLGDNKILQHLPNKLSGIDTLELSKIKGIYRYGN